MNNQRRNFRLTCALLAAVLAVGVAGCAQPAEDKQPQGKTQQLWIADNFVDPQEGYPMEIRRRSSFLQPPLCRKTVCSTGRPKNSSRARR